LSANGYQKGVTIDELGRPSGLPLKYPEGAITFDESPPKVFQSQDARIDIEWGSEDRPNVRKSTIDLLEMRKTALPLSTSCAAGEVPIFGRSYNQTIPSTGAPSKAFEVSISLPNVR
jgi:hypothetical protein